MKLYDVILRPQVHITDFIETILPLKEMVDSIPNRRDEIIEAAEVLIKVFRLYRERKIDC